MEKGIRLKNPGRIIKIKTTKLSIVGVKYFFSSKNNLIKNTKKSSSFRNWIFEIFYERARLKYKNNVSSPKTMFGIHEATNGETYPFSENVDVVCEKKM